MPELIVAPSARADLLAPWDYFADEVGRPDLGDRFVSSAELTFTNLARTPGLGRPRKSRSPKAKNIRSWKVDNFPMYLIFSRPMLEAGGVEIVRVIHGARDLEALFNEKRVFQNRLLSLALET